MTRSHLVPSFKLLTGFALVVCIAASVSYPTQAQNINVPLHLKSRHHGVGSVTALAARIAALDAKAEAKDKDSDKDIDAESASAGLKDQHVNVRGKAPKSDPDEFSGTDFLHAYLNFMLMRAYPNDTVDTSAYVRARKHRDAMPAARIGETPPRTSPVLVRAEDIGSGSTWQFVGPTNLPVPYEIYYGQGAINGRVTTCAFDPNNTGTYLIGGADGGVWKTTDSGTTWTSLTDNNATWSQLQVEAIAIDHTNSNTIWVGTGDYYGFAALGGLGLMKTTDGGQTWTNPGSSQFGSSIVTNIIIDPETTSTVTVSTAQGNIWRTTDGGTTWSNVLSASTSFCDLQCGALNTSNSSRYYWAVGVNEAQSFGGSTTAIYQSSNRGATWTTVTLPTLSTNQETIRIATSPTSPSTLYLISASDEALYKSTNGGSSWSNISTGFPNGNSETGATYNWSQSNYDIHLECSTYTDSGNVAHDVVYAGLIDLAQSPNGGSTWQSIGGPTYADSGSLIHNDQHALAINPNNPNEALVGNDGGVYDLIYNPTANTWSYTSLNTNLGITQFYKISVAPNNPDVLIGGTQDNATPASVTSLSNWLDVGGGDGGGSAIDQANPAVQYTTSEYMSYYDTDDYWNDENYFAPNLQSDDNPPFTPIVALDPNNSNLMYTGSNYLWQYNATTQTWSAHLGGKALSNYWITAIAIAPTNSSVIYTGAADGQIWMSSTKGTTWKSLNANSLPSAAITSISVNPTNADDVLVGLSGSGSANLYHCANTAAASVVWTNVSGSGETGLPRISLNGIARDPVNPATTWYVAMDVGVFETTDSGAQWSNATAPDGLPNVQVNDLQVASASDVLYAGTFGRGMWNIQLTLPAPALTSISPSTATAGATAFTLTVTGSDFVASSVVNWNGTPLTTTYVSSTELQAAAAAPLVATAGNDSVTVTNPSPGGGTTTSATFAVDNPSPSVTSLVPVSTLEGGQQFTLTVNGRNFVAGSTVDWNASSLNTFFVSSTELQATVGSSLITTAGTASVTVVNAAPGGGTSTAASFAIDNPAPTLSEISPTSATAGGPQFTLAVTGGGFVAGSVVKWNSTPIATTLVSPTSVTATVPAADIASTGTAAVVVLNPQPGGGTSSSSNFTISTNPAPALGLISPTAANAGSPGFVLNLTGANFDTGSVVHWAGAAVPTTLLSSTSITAQISAAQVFRPGKVDVVVANPAPGGGTTKPQSFTILLTNLAVTVTGLSRDSQSNIHVTIKIQDTGQKNAFPVVVKAATLAGLATTTTLPLNLGGLLPGKSASTTLVFPKTAGTTGQQVSLVVSGTSSAGAFSGIVNVTLP